MGKRTILDSDALVEARRKGVTVREMAKRFGCSTSRINVELSQFGETNWSWDYDPTPEEMERWCEAHVGDLRREHPSMEGVR